VYGVELASALLVMLKVPVKPRTVNLEDERKEDEKRRLEVQRRGYVAQFRYAADAVFQMCHGKTGRKTNEQDRL
jgi:hypothetical protein